MKKNDLGFELQSRVRMYLEYTLKNEDNEEGLKNILNKLTKSLRSEVLYESYGRYINENDFFKRFSGKTKEKIILSISEVKFSPEEIIYKVKHSINWFHELKRWHYWQEQEFNDSCLYILTSGTVEEILGSEKNGKCHTLRTIAVYYYVQFPW